eukprot:1164854-Prymnesium_polylepis.1
MSGDSEGAEAAGATPAPVGSDDGCVPCVISVLRVDGACAVKCDPGDLGRGDRTSRGLRMGSASRTPTLIVVSREPSRPQCAACELRDAELRELVSDRRRRRPV